MSIPNGNAETRMNRRYHYYLITLLILALDHASKWLISVQLADGGQFEIIPGFLRFSLVHNSGVAFGLFSESMSAWKPWALAALALAALTAIFVYSIHTPPGRRLLQCALAVTMGGILGNLIDRIVRGYVVDFIDVHLYETFSWPTFNIADSAITIGIALLLIDTAKAPDSEGPFERPAEAGRS